jgi:hypothetical protein
MSRDRLPIEPQPGLIITELDVKARDDMPLRVRLYKSDKEESAHLPLFVYIHGGGYVTGGLETDDRYCRLVAQETKVLVLSIEYRLAPENKFPAGWEDCRDVVRWVSGRDCFHICQETSALTTIGSIRGRQTHTLCRFDQKLSARRHISRSKFHCGASTFLSRTREQIGIPVDWHCGLGW